MKAAPTLTPAAALLTALIPADDREAIVGDLVEEIGWRDLRGARLTLWVARHCFTIAIGLAGERLRALLTLTAAREVASGLAVEGGRAFRSGWSAPRTLAARAAVFAMGVAALALSVELLVGALMAAAGLRS